MKEERRRTASLKWKIWRRRTTRQVREEKEKEYRKWWMEKKEEEEKRRQRWMDLKEAVKEAAGVVIEKLSGQTAMNLARCELAAEHAGGLQGG